MLPRTKITAFALLALLAPSCVAEEEPEVALDDTSAALTVAQVWAGPDRDLDGLPDLIDNCPDTANAEAYDADGDGVGNACDADYDNDGAVTGLDFAAFNAAYGSAQGSASFNPLADHVTGSSNVIAGEDFAVFQRHFGRPVPASNLVALDAARDGDTLLTVWSNPAPGGFTRGVSLRPIVNVRRHASGALDSFQFLDGAAASTLKVTDDGMWLATGPQFCLRLGILDPARFAGNSLEYHSSCDAAPTHLGFHLLPMRVDP